MYSVHCMRVFLQEKLKEEKMSYSKYKNLCNVHVRTSLLYGQYLSYAWIVQCTCTCNRLVGTCISNFKVESESAVLKNKVHSG